MLFGDDRIVEFVLLVVKFDDGAGQHLAFRNAQALGQRAGGDIAHHHLQRNDLDFLDQLLAHVDAFDEVGRNADFGSIG